MGFMRAVRPEQIEMPTVVGRASIEYFRQLVMSDTLLDFLPLAGCPSRVLPVDPLLPAVEAGLQPAPTATLE